MNYVELLKKIKSYKNQYKIRVIGKTKFKRKIFAVERNLNKNFATAIFVCSIHARENIATDLICKMLDDGLFEDVKKFNLSFILMANPDGVELVENGVLSVPENHRINILKINKNSYNFRLWKANANGVDLNNNFDARFGTNVHSFEPASSGWPGRFAESENETKAIVKYLKQTKPFIVVCYHTKGEEIYYNFFQTGQRLERDRIIAEKFAKSTGYVIKNPEMTRSGGLKDYVIEKLKIPSLTIELGSDELSHPIGKEYLQDLFERNKNVAKDLNFAYNVFVETKG